MGTRLDWQQGNGYKEMVTRKWLQGNGYKEMEINGDVNISSVEKQIQTI